jgi:hypothetical protein
MKIKKIGLLGVAVLALVAVLPLSAVAAGAQHVTWDIISLGSVPLAPPVTFNPGGEASAQAPDGEWITLTGSGTFVAPSGSNGGSGAVTGVGTWETSLGGSTTGSGTYVVKDLVSWEFDSPQTLNIGGLPVTDNTGDTTKRANGVAVLRIEFSDGASGVLTVGCHGPGSIEAGIFEGIATTKGVETYYDVPVPSPAVNEGRTLFHVL